MPEQDPKFPQLDDEQIARLTTLGRNTARSKPGKPFSIKEMTITESS